MSALRLFAIAGCLALVAGVLVGIARLGGGGEGARALAASVFLSGAPPAGFEVAEATHLASGEDVLRLERSAEAASGAGPEALWLVRYPSLGAAAQLFAAGDFLEEGPGPGTQASLDKLRWDKDPSFTFHTEVESGFVAWDRWQADYRVERVYREGGGWQELSRVNLGQQGRALVLFARWPAGTSHSKAELERLVRTIAMLPPEEEEPPG
jgi:hypothetical protein